MSKARFEITGQLKTLSPLHVGSGAFDVRETVKGREGEKPPEVALIVGDGDGAPFLPATTLKGLLRRLAEAHKKAFNADDLTALFGEIKDEGQGRMGALLMRGAQRVHPIPDVSLAPYTGDGTGPTLGQGVFVAARTRIDPASGTARDSNLFFQEMVAPGTIFALRCLVEVRGDQAAAMAQRRAEQILTLLRLLAEDAGHAVGKGQADGFGHLLLDPKSVRVARRSLERDGRFAATDATNLWHAAQAPSNEAVEHRLELTCEGPFCIIDGSYKPNRREASSTDKRERASTTPQIMAQRLSERLPLLLGSGLSGALRNRAHWLAVRTALREGTPWEEEEVPTDLAKLSSVQRLFGVTGFRGLLSIDRLTVSSAKPWQVTSVKLDRFSGAPVDNALFTTQAFIGVRLSLSLRLERRGNFPDESHETLLQALLDDIRRNGIDLGHGGNKGFGWFKVEGEINGQ